jgi:hypothetical protein
VAFEHLVSEGQAFFVEGDAHCHLRAIVALLLVFAVVGLGVVAAKPLEVRVGDVVENDAAVRGEEVGFTLT